jgi:membrane-associated phospholipid phosphatase
MELEFLANWISIGSEFFVIHFLIMYFLATFNMYVAYLIGFTLLKVGLNKLMKRCSMKFLPEYIALRPINAGKCSICNDGLYNDTDPGFPSGHAWIMTSVAVEIYLEYGMIQMTVASIGLAVATCWARNYKNCHTWEQIAVGVLCGIPYGILVHACVPKSLELDKSTFWRF